MMLPAPYCVQSDLQSCVVAVADVSDDVVDAVVDGHGGIAHHSQNSPGVRPNKWDESE